MTDLVPALLGSPRFLIEPARTRTDYYRLRRRVFVDEQKLFAASDLDDRDDDPRTIVLEARDPSGALLGGVRLGPATDGPDIGWWQGGRLVVDPAVRGAQGIGPALVRAACAAAEEAGALRFDASVQARFRRMFERLGWESVRSLTVAGQPHHLMRWPIGRIAALAAATKNPLGGLLDGLNPGGGGFVGDDGAPVPGTDLIAACDAILPSMVERDPDWAGWCAVLVNVNDLAAMGATPVGLLNAIGARDAAHAARIIGGLKRAAEAYGIPILGGHTQLGVPASLSATALGRTADPAPGSDGNRHERARPANDPMTGGSLDHHERARPTTGSMPGGGVNDPERAHPTTNPVPDGVNPGDRVRLTGSPVPDGGEHPGDRVRRAAGPMPGGDEHPDDRVRPATGPMPGGDEHPDDRVRPATGPMPGGD
uniref:MSMEG_0567/Sll0786 family nitrogen starvation N-acetyltransferase n=1 Tax=Paractinoplanes polyasparticus TaxID=2856853 RepID=UPI001C854844